MNAPTRILPAKLGKYEVRREVGRGGMGIVYEGFDPLIDRRVALKTFINEFFDGTQSDNLLTRLRREAQAAGRLSHPNIIAVYEYGEDSVPDADGGETKTAFIAMEFIEGRSLESYFEANERFPVREIERIMAELLDALEYSHAHGVVHRDIKPANIILLKDGSVKVADFGVARIESSTLTQVGTVLGSPSYMSPEQFMGQTVDGRSDLYSAGVVLYQLLTAEVPFTGAFTTIMHKVLNDSPPPPSALNFQVPKGYDAILRRAMAKRPDERYQTAAEFKQAILSASSGAAQAGAAQAAGAPEGGNQTVMRPQTPQAPGAVRPASNATRPRALSPAMLFTLLALLLASAAAAYFVLGPRFGLPLTAKLGPASPPPAQGADRAPRASDEAAVGSSAGGQSGGGEGGSAIISAVGLADPSDPRYSNDPAGLERTVWRDARREVVAKAAALYVDPNSINANYPIVRDKLLAHSDEFIKTVLDQSTPQMSQYGLMVGTMRASVNVREVQKTLNQISHDDRIEFIRNNGDPRISVTVRAGQPGDEANADPNAQAPRSPVAENLLKERIRSFGFTVVDDASAKPPADFRVEGEVHFKRLSAKLAASGLTIEKFVITSWTVKAIDAKSGEEIYHNTAIPEKQSWASQELALQDVGQLIGAEFTKTFFLQYFDFKPKKARLRFSGLPATAAIPVLAEINSSLVVLNAAPVPQQGSDLVVDTQLSGGNATAANLVEQGLLGPLNRKLGMSCFTLLASGDDSELHIAFSSTCMSDATLKRLQNVPPASLTGAPPSRIQDVVKDPNLLHRVQT
ncbi:MAG TPA: serine/threonine-protein kinase [Steroidobacteraceae bacterium]|nr:serine/threonine-protein kinase [Steroidobacteraceae bacterium]